MCSAFDNLSHLNENGKTKVNTFEMFHRVLKLFTYSNEAIFLVYKTW